MTLHRFSPALLLAGACIGSLLVSVPEASALVLPPDDGGEDVDPGASTAGSQGAGGSVGVDAPPPGIYLNRYTYYVGEVITGQLDCPDCSTTGPIFHDQMGIEFSGTLIYSETHHGAFVFLPDAPLPVGMYLVDAEYATTDFEVIEGEPAPAFYEARLFEQLNPAGEPIECQSTVPGYSETAHPQTRVDAGLTISIGGESSDQYQYEFSIDADATRTSTSAGFPLATFRKGHGEFCVEVFALPYTDSPDVSLGTVCMDPDAELMLGVRDTPHGSLSNLLATCELPPDGYADEWCAYHTEAFTRHSCAGFIEEACVQARYECPDGDLPEWYDENGLDPDEPNAPNNGTGGGGGGNETGGNGAGASGGGGEDGVGADSGDQEDVNEAGGCSCSTGISGSFGAGNRAFLFVGLGGALIALRRRERKLLR